MSRYPSENLGELERVQSLWELYIIVGFRWALIALCLLTLFTAIQELIKFAQLPKKEARLVPPSATAAYFATRAVLAVAILCQAPSAFYRLGNSRIDPEFAFNLQMVSIILLVLYFILDEFISALAALTPPREALWRLTPFVVAALLLVFLGVNSNVRS